MESSRRPTGVNNAADVALTTVPRQESCFARQHIAIGLVRIPVFGHCLINKSRVGCKIGPLRSLDRTGGTSMEAVHRVVQSRAMLKLIS